MGYYKYKFGYSFKKEKKMFMFFSSFHIMWCVCVDRPCRQCVWWSQSHLHPSTTTRVRRESWSYCLSYKPLHVPHGSFSDLYFKIYSCIYTFHIPMPYGCWILWYSCNHDNQLLCSALITLPSNVLLSLIVKGTVFTSISD